MSRDEWLHLEDVRTCCQKVLRFSEGMTFEAFRSDEKTFDAVIRNLEIIGEASKHSSQEIRNRNPNVSWRGMTGFRDIVSHAYFTVNAHIVWDIVETKIPPLLEHVSLILATEPTNDEVCET